jgi:hypothetical protein
MWKHKLFVDDNGKNIMNCGLATQLIVFSESNYLPCWFVKEA